MSLSRETSLFLMQIVNDISVPVSHDNFEQVTTSLIKAKKELSKIIEDPIKQKIEDSDFVSSDE